MTEAERKKEPAPADRRFEREEMGELLRLFSALGITLAAGIVGFFFAGLKLDAWLTAAGLETHSLGKIAGLLIGLCLSVSWAYARIARHLKKFAPEQDAGKKDGSHEKSGK